MSAFTDQLGLGAFALTSLVGISVAANWPSQNGETVAVMFPPWTDGAQAAGRAADAGADIVGFGRFSFIVVVRPLVDGYLRRVFEEGAVLVLDTGDIRGCSTNRKPALSAS